MYFDTTYMMIMLPMLLFSMWAGFKTKSAFKKYSKVRVMSGQTGAQAAKTLLDHWTIRKPIGPCQFGIGTLFKQVEYPFLRYNLFSYVYILSFYKQAQADERFLEAFALLGSKLDDEGRLIVERPNRKLSGLTAFKKGRGSMAATVRFQEILDNLEGAP